MIETAIDDAVELSLRDDNELRTAMGGTARLYPLSAPAGAAFPHIIFGENQILDWGDDCLEGYEIYVTVKVWCQDNEGGPTVTMAQAKRLSGLVRERLNSSINIPGFRIVDHRLETNRSMPDGDGLSTLGLVEVRYWVEASA